MIAFTTCSSTRVHRLTDGGRGWADVEAGSLFLIDRRCCRYFRKDGHNWRKKKDGKTVRETHEKLKVMIPAGILCCASPQWGRYGATGTGWATRRTVYRGLYGVRTSGA